MSFPAVSLKMCVHAIAQEALRIKSYDLRPIDGAPLPAFAAGAHIDLLLPNGMSRSYSLISSPTDRMRYVVAVTRDENSRGGSSFLHESVSVGDVIAIQPPRNLFELNEAAENTILIAGGIGITPIYSMARRLAELGRRWSLLYCARSAAQAAMLEPIAALPKSDDGRVDLRFDEAPNYVRPNFEDIVSQAPKYTHFYCCGPASLMAAFAAAVRDIPSEQIHTESFVPVSGGDGLGGFTVVLKQSGLSLYVPKGQTILEVVRAAGLDPVAMCEEGTCGTCEVAVLDGVPHHRDHVLSEEDKADGLSIMICCSGSKGERLVIDL